MACVEYDFYANEYLGEAISSRDFPRLAARAAEYVAGKTRGLSQRAQSTEAREAVGKAICAVAEALQNEERMRETTFSATPAVASETVGSWSRSYQSSGLSAAQTEYLTGRKLEALELYLGGVPDFAALFGVRGYRCGHRR